MMPVPAQINLEIERRKIYQSNHIEYSYGGLILVKCPRCEMEVSAASKEWDYSFFHVKMFDCKRCNKSFKVYYCEGKLSHTIPKRK